MITYHQIYLTPCAQHQELELSNGAKLYSPEHGKKGGPQGWQWRRWSRRPHVGRRSGHMRYSNDPIAARNPRSCRAQLQLIHHLNLFVLHSIDGGHHQIDLLPNLAHICCIGIHLALYCHQLRSQSGHHLVDVLLPLRHLLD
jgi:hypothetical protein